MTLFFLIRHGENDYTRTGKLAGWTPGVHLNEVGQKQAQGLAERLKHVPFTALYATPLERTQETLAPLARLKDLPVEIVEGLGEIRYGAWQGRSLKQLARTKLWQTVQTRPSAMQFPQGETLRAAQARAVDALERLHADYPKALLGVCSHGDIIKLVAAHYLGLPLDMYQRLVVSTASVSVLRLGNSQPALLKFNDTGKLEVK